MAASSTTANHVLDVLLLFDGSRSTLTAEEIGDLIDAPRSSTYRYIRTLRERGLLQRTADGGFAVGPRVLQLAQAVRRQQENRKAMLAIMQELSEQSGETVVLMRLFDRTPMCVDRVLGPQTIRTNIEPGQIQPLHAGAASKVLLAHLPEEVWDSYLEPPLQAFTERTIVDLQRLKSQLRQIRQEGYCISDGEVELGIRALAVPLHDSQNKRVLALSIVGPAFRMDDEVLAEQRKLLQNAAKAVEEQGPDALL